MQLSARLQAVAALVNQGHRVADIGTDHAYVPIFLIEQKISPFVIAMDVREGPLEKAAAHVRVAGLEEKIELRLSDGLEKLHPGEADTVILSGMGGGLMSRILRKHREVVSSLKECVLQPQSEVCALRSFLAEEGFSLLAEDIVQEDGKFYPMMKLSVPHDKSSVSEMRWDAVSLRYGKFLLEKKHPVLKEYLEKEQRLYRQIYERLNTQPGERSRSRLAEIENELEQIRKGLAYYEV